AGPIRNARMVLDGADLCLAFIHNHSRGASGCADYAEQHGIRTIRNTEPFASARAISTNARFDALVAGWTDDDSDFLPGTNIPKPGRCHPYYAQNGAVLDWINGLTFEDSHVLCVPKPPPSLARLITETNFDTEPPTASQDVITLTRSYCAGLAPYVGRPFVYRWAVAKDGLGRTVAGEMHIHYIAAAGHSVKTRDGSGGGS
ncbi:MAG TPA: hypothetical protein VFX70_06390, partial [Mycobacteriales bacterium]|nr:hypothetical protein [Mycobacteriales bacterium]